MNPRAHAAAPNEWSADASSAEPSLRSPDELVWGAEVHDEGRRVGALLAPPPVDATPALLEPPPDRTPIEPGRPVGIDDVTDLREFAASVEAGRRDAHRLRWLVGGLVSAIVFAALVFGGIRLAERRDRPPAPTVPDAAELMDPSSIARAVVLAEDLDRASGELASMSFRWTDPSGQRLDVETNAIDGTFEMVTDDGVELRFDGEAYEGRATDGSEDAAWQTIAGDPFARRPIIGLDGLPTVDDVIPAPIAAHTIAEVSDGPTTVVVIDDEALSEADPMARADWLATWGLPSAGGPTDQIEVLMTSTSTGIVTLTAIVEPTLGGVASYELGSYDMIDS